MAMKPCPQCSKPVPGNIRFCPYCGGKIQISSRWRKFGGYFVRMAIFLFILFLLFLALIVYQNFYFPWKGKIFTQTITASIRSSDVVLVYTLPGGGEAIAGTVSNGQQVEVFAQNPIAIVDDKDWIHIRAENVADGWITLNFVNIITPVSKAEPVLSPEKDGMTMAYVSSGYFLMGRDEQDAHLVYLDSFWMDKTEVTNAMYARCVQAGACQPPKYAKSATRNSYFLNPEYDYHPVIYVDWDMAKSYCEWAGRRLPTEAEWEKAARGPWLPGETSRTYPWGEDISCDKANYSGCVGDTTKVGSYPDGVSPYGIYDMAGNVWEWVNDWYDNNYYQGSPLSNPLGPSWGRIRVLRGGSWSSNYLNVRSAYRNRYLPTYTYFNGFRCSRSLPVP